MGTRGGGGRGGRSTASASKLRSFARSRGYRLVDHGQSDDARQRFNIRRGRESMWADNVTSARSMIRRAGILDREQRAWRRRAASR